MSQPCKHCSSTEHTSFYCRLKPRRYIKRTPLAQRGKHFFKWMEIRAQWIALHYGESFVCHYCGIPLRLDKLTLDHLEARSRHPELRYVLDNLVPACSPCNKDKGSLSHAEYRHTCHVVEVYDNR